MRVLYVEDEKDLLEVTAKRLVKDGFSVDCCMNGREALDYVRLSDYDAVILDIMLPQMDGLTVLHILRDEGNAVPVLLLTARDSVADRVKGLDTGADDYLVKPFAYDELLARLRAMIRRKPGENATNILRCADLEADLATRRVTRAGVEITLSRKEFAILEYLLRNRSVVLSRDRIEQQVWGYDYEGDSNVIDVYIRCLRKKIDADRPDKLIHTVRGIGYVLRSESN